jgi:hypothetical protein
LLSDPPEARWLIAFWGVRKKCIAASGGVWIAGGYLILAGILGCSRVNRTSDTLSTQKVVLISPIFPTLTGITNFNRCLDTGTMLVWMR